MDELLAELWSCSSALAIVAVGLRHSSPCVVMFGAGSVLAHAAPPTVGAAAWAPGAVALALRLASLPPGAFENPVVRAAAAVAVGAAAINRCLRGGTMSRVLWHLAAALALYCLERAGGGAVLV